MKMPFYGGEEAKMQENKQNQNTPDLSTVSVKFGLKSFITVVAILLAIVIVTGVLTFVIPAGQYAEDPETGKILVDQFGYVDNSESRLPVWRWFTAPIEALFSKGSFNIIQVIALLLILGGTFKVLEDSGGLVALIKVVIGKFYQHRYIAIWMITLVIMLLAALFGIQEQLLILFPVFLMLAQAMTWSKVTAISLILITSGVGFTTAILNPFTSGIAAEEAGESITVLLGYRLAIFVVMYVVTSAFLVFMAKRDERCATGKVDLSRFQMDSEEERKELTSKAVMIFLLFGIALGVVVLSLAIPAISKLGLSMVFMAVAFVVGTVIVGKKLLGTFRKLGKSFWQGMVAVSPSVLIIMVAFSVKYIADKGMILHTIFHYFHGVINGTSPYLAILLLYLFILVVEFFIPSASTKAVLIIPMLTLAPIEGLSVPMILLTYLFADGYTNVLFPTCSTLMVGLSLAEISYVEWVKKTIWLQLIMLVLSVGFLMLGLALGF